MTGQGPTLANVSMLPRASCFLFPPDFPAQLLPADIVNDQTPYDCSVPPYLLAEVTSRSMHPAAPVARATLLLHVAILFIHSGGRHEDTGSGSNSSTGVDQ